MSLPTKLSAVFGDALNSCLHDGVSVELDGLGVFQQRGEKPRFLASRRPKVFIAYVIEDLPLALRLYDALAGVGMNPWLDRNKLLPGQNWRRCIERAVDVSDFFIACFSQTAATKRGQFPYEVRYALKCAERMPLDDIYFVPVRFEECKVPQRITSQIQYVDLFPNWEAGLHAMTQSLVQEWGARTGSRAA